MVLAGAGSLRDIESHWSIDDLADANEALDIRDEAEDAARKRQERASKTR